MSSRSFSIDELGYNVIKMCDTKLFFHNLEALFRENILGQSADIPEGTPVVSGVDFNNYKHRNITVAELINAMSNTGFSASHMSQAASIVKDEMVSLWLLELLTSLG